MRTALALSSVLILLTGCMTEREYMLRKSNAENQAAHPTTFEVAHFVGPLTLEDGGEIKIVTPNQPFKPLNVPDGADYQRAVIRDAITGAVIGYGLYRAGSTTTTKSITTNPAP